MIKSLLFLDEIPFYVIKSRNKARQCESDDISCTFTNHNIVLNDTGFASCIKYNEILSERFDYTKKDHIIYGPYMDDHIKCCDGNNTTCNTDNGMFKPIVSGDDESVVMALNSAIKLGHILERMYTCECDFSDSTDYEKHFLAVSDLNVVKLCGEAR